MYGLQHGIMHGTCSRADLEIWEGHYRMPVKTMQKDLPRFLCEYCIETTYIATD